MKFLIIVLFFFLQSIAIKAQSQIFGEYGNVIRINPDSTYFQACLGCLLKDTIYGIWRLEKDTITLTFDKDDPLANNFINNQKVIITGDTLFELSVNYKSKNLKTIGLYSNGLKSFKGRWYSSWENGDKKDGKWTYYHINGIISKISTYEKGVLTRETLIFDIEGNLIQSIVYNKKGQIDGDITYYYPNGKIKRVIQYRNGYKNGKDYLYYDTGKNAYSGIWKKDLKQGDWIFTSKNGISKTKVTYNKGQINNKSNISPESNWIILNSEDDIIKAIIDTDQK